MFTESEEFYDIIYSTFKDYPGEAARIAELLRGLQPRCRTVLDVASGTGEHARLLALLGFEVDGLDLDPAFVRIASRKHPAGRFFQGDMTDFRLPYRYDAVLCLFSSIGYLKTLDRVGRALIRFREHLQPGGVILVEPWLQPGVLDTTRITRQAGEANGVRVSRVTRAEAEERLSRLIFDYEITDGNGTRHAHEVHELGLFTTAELMDTFRAAGLDAHHDPKGLCDRGLFAATVAEPPRSLS
jgi:SAM-dependent methyltransferase